MSRQNTLAQNECNTIGLDKSGYQINIFLSA